MTTDLGPNLDLSIPAGADLSSSQFLFVKYSGANVIVCAAATDQPIGVLQNKPKSGEMAQVRAIGVTKLQADAALATIGTKIGTSVDGQADAKVAGTDTTEYTVGVTLTTSAAAAEVISALINCAAPSRAA